MNIAMELVIVECMRAENTDFEITDDRVTNQVLNIGANTSRYFH